MTRQKRNPQRSCIACREVKDKRQLVRIVRTPENKITLDPTGKTNGRGAYLCRKADCWNKGLQKGRIIQALKITVSAQELTTLKACLQAEFAKA